MTSKAPEIDKAFNEFREIPEHLRAGADRIPKSTGLGEPLPNFYVLTLSLFS